MNWAVAYVALATLVAVASLLAHWALSAIAVTGINAFQVGAYSSPITKYPNHVDGLVVLNEVIDGFNVTVYRVYSMNVTMVSLGLVCNGLPTESLLRLELPSSAGPMAYLVHGAQVGPSLPLGPGECAELIVEPRGGDSLDVSLNLQSRNLAIFSRIIIIFHGG